MRKGHWRGQFEPWRPAMPSEAMPLLAVLASLTVLATHRNPELQITCQPPHQAVEWWFRLLANPGTERFTTSWSAFVEGWRPEVSTLLVGLIRGPSHSSRIASVIGHHSSKWPMVKPGLSRTGWMANHQKKNRFHQQTWTRVGHYSVSGHPHVLHCRKAHHDLFWVSLCRWLMLVPDEWPIIDH